MAVYSTLANYAANVTIGDTEEFESFVFCDSSDKWTKFVFYVVQNDAEKLIVYRQYQPGRRRDLTEYRGKK